MGVSRASTVVIAYRMQCLGESLLQAYTETRAKRSCINPNYGFFGVLTERELASGAAASITLKDYAIELLRKDMGPYVEFGVDDEAIASAYEEAGGDWTAEKCPDRRGFEAAVKPNKFSCNESTSFSVRKNLS